MLHDHDLSVGERARLSSPPRGTYSVWRHRNIIPNGLSPYDEAVAGAIVRTLTTNLGLTAHEASALLAAVRHRWRPAPGAFVPAYLIATRTERGTWRAEVT